MVHDHRNCLLRRKFYSKYAGLEPRGRMPSGGRQVPSPTQRFDASRYLMPRISRSVYASGREYQFYGWEWATVIVKAAGVESGTGVVTLHDAAARSPAAPPSPIVRSRRGHIVIEGSSKTQHSFRSTEPA